MQCYEWIPYKNKRILYMKLNAKTTEEAKEITETIKPVVAKEPPNSILCIADVNDSKFNPETTQILKEFTKHNKPFMKMTAVLGVEGLKKVIYSGVLLFTGRKNLILKNSKQEAMDWLVEQ